MVNLADACRTVTRMPWCEALEPFQARQLDSLYLSPGFGVWLWSHGRKVVIEWNNRGRLLDGQPAWTASGGKREMDRDEFIKAQSFDQASP